MIKLFVCIILLSAFTVSVSSFCEDEWTLYKGNCYKWFTWIKTDYDTAEGLCQEVKAKVLTIDNEKEDAFVTKYFSHIENKYIWVNSKESKFGKSITGDKKRGKCTAVHFLGKFQSQWIKSDCENHHYDVVCKMPQRDIADIIQELVDELGIDLCHRSTPFTKSPTRFTPTYTPITPPTTAAPTVAPTTQSPGSCPQGWRKFNNRCFKGYSESKISRDKAESRCESVDAHLASIHSKAENDLVIEIGKQFGNESYLWIGAKNGSSNYPFNFKWIDGSEWDYSNWPKENKVPEEDSKNVCVEIDLNKVDGTLFGHWKNIDCDNSWSYGRSFVCAKKLS